MINTLSLLIQILVGIGQIVALFIAYRLAIRQFRMVQAARYLERFLSPEMVSARTAVDVWATETDLSKRLAALSGPQNAALLNSVRSFANFFQELGIAWRRGLVDQEYVKDVFDVLVCKYWTTMHGWIADYRQRSDKSLYSKWEDLRNQLRETSETLKNL